MDYISKNDYYEIRFASMITNVDKDTLLELYQPLIGAAACALYLTMLKQKRNADGGTIFKMEQLLKTMQLSADSLLSARHYLEAVGLIRTFESKSEDVRCYIYQVLSPKSPKAFFEDVLFSGLLIQAVGDKEAKRLANKYKVNLTIPEEYKEVSASFVDVYKPNYDDPAFFKTFGHQIIGRDHGRAQLTFNHDLFFKYIGENSELDASQFKKKDMKEIERLATLFGLNEKQMANIVVKEYWVNGSLHLEFDKIKNRAEEEIKVNVTPVNEKSNVSGDSDLASKIQMMDEVAPAKFLQYLQNGTKPARSDINIINSLSKDYGFGNGIINVIVDYVLNKNSNVLSKNYCEKIASSLAREGCKSTVDAMNYLNKISVKVTKKVSPKKPAAVNIEEEETDEDVSLDEINALIGEVEVKKNVRWIKNI